jgi:hypothetical protein
VCGSSATARVSEVAAMRPLSAPVSRLPATIGPTIDAAIATSLADGSIASASPPAGRHASSGSSSSASCSAPMSAKRWLASRCITFCSSSVSAGDTTTAGFSSLTSGGSPFRISARIWRGVLPRNGRRPASS